MWAGEQEVSDSDMLSLRYLSAIQVDLRGQIQAGVVIFFQHVNGINIMRWDDVTRE